MKRALFGASVLIVTLAAVIAWGAAAGYAAAAILCALAVLALS
jgi:hypothetical protein